MTVGKLIELLKAEDKDSVDEVNGVVFVNTKE
jgi:hypothetical protein